MSRYHQGGQPVATESKPAEQTVKPRAQRYISHALVEVRRFRILPFFCYSAVLLDISVGGFKLEFTGEIEVAPGNQYWLNIPLSPLGIYAPKRLMCRCECRWFDSSRFRMGGTFVDLSKTDHLLIEQVVSSLKSRGQL
jgi:hypothetical protein